MPDKVVDIPGFGNVAFPDNMSDQDISTAIQRNAMKGTFGPGMLPKAGQRPSLNMSPVGRLSGQPMEGTQDVAAEIKAKHPTLYGLGGAMFKGAAEPMPGGFEVPGEMVPGIARRVSTLARSPEVRRYAIKLLPKGEEMLKFGQSVRNVLKPAEEEVAKPGKQATQWGKSMLKRRVARGGGGGTPVGPAKRPMGMGGPRFPEPATPSEPVTPTPSTPQAGEAVGEAGKAPGGGQGKGQFLSHAERSSDLRKQLFSILKERGLDANATRKQIEALYKGRSWSSLTDAEQAKLVAYLDKNGKLPPNPL